MCSLTFFFPFVFYLSKIKHLLFTIIRDHQGEEIGGGFCAGRTEPADIQSEGREEASCITKYETPLTKMSVRMRRGRGAGLRSDAQE